MTSRPRELQGQPDSGLRGAAAARHQHVGVEDDGQFPVNCVVISSFLEGCSVMVCAD